jgi:predicted RNA-binding Zn ribbon-like protein
MDLTEAIPGAALAVSLVNSVDELASPRDRLDDPDWLRRWLHHHGFEAAAAVVRPEDVGRARELRDRFAAAFDAATADDAVEVLNAIVAEFAEKPRLERVGGGWVFGYWPPQEAGLRFAAAYGAVGLLDAIRVLGWERFGRCDGTPCRCVYIDRTRNNRRRYCCHLCADRMAQAALRRRRKARA